MTNRSFSQLPRFLRLLHLDSGPLLEFVIGDETIGLSRPELMTSLNLAEQEIDRRPSPAGTHRLNVLRDARRCLSRFEHE